MIIDYTEYTTQHEEYGLNSGPRKKDDESLFFHKREYCVFCNKKTTKIYSDINLDLKTIEGVAWHKIHDVFSCNCGWWEHTFYGYLEGEHHGYKDWAFEVNSGILRQFDINSNQIPLEILSNHLKKKSDDIYNIHHKKMEELVGSVLSEHYDCEAHVIGRSNDGGIDLILIESDDPIAVQVKRRMLKGKVEPVSQIRELIGATLLAGYHQCAYVTTADHFSKSAVDTTEIALQKGLVQRFDLIDFDKFVYLLSLTKSKNNIPWKKLVLK